MSLSNAMGGVLGREVGREGNGLLIPVFPSIAATIQPYTEIGENEGKEGIWGFRG